MVDSTQTRCKDVCKDTSNEMLRTFFDQEDFSSKTLYLISADMQSSSYGRDNRTWHSVDGNFLGTYMFFWPQQILRKLPYTSQTVALAVSAVIEEQGLETQVKWTNDVLIGGKKAAGILCDAFPVEGGSMLLMGIGLNVNMDAEAAHQKFLTTEDAMKIEFTSMAIASRNSFDLEGITSSLSRNLVDRLITLQNGQFAEHLLPEVESRLAFRGETVVFSDGAERLENVIFEGLTSDGFARLRDENGVIQEKMTGRIRPHH